MKRCSDCKGLREFSSFHHNRAQPDGYANICKVCFNERDKEYKKKHREKARLTQRKENLSKMSVSLIRYQELLEKQGGVCAICGHPPNGKPLSVDHDHKCCPHVKRCCGKCVRGLLCSNCNTGIGLFKDDSTRLQRAIVYLTGWGY